MQVKGNADLRYPPEDVVTEGREAIVAYLLANMRYEDTEGCSRSLPQCWHRLFSLTSRWVSVASAENANKHVQMANMAESRAKDDEEAADLARSLVKPLEVCVSQMPALSAPTHLDTYPKNPDRVPRH